MGLNQIGRQSPLAISTGFTLRLCVENGHNGVDKQVISDGFSLQLYNTTDDSSCKMAMIRTQADQASKIHEQMLKRIRVYVWYILVKDLMLQAGLHL